MTSPQLLLPKVRFLNFIDKHFQVKLTRLQAGFILGDPINFVVSLSEKLADFAPQLTLDFIHEVSAAMTGMDKSSVSHRINCLQYMSPWIRNLSHFSNAIHPLYERSGARLRDCIRTLSDLSLTFPEVRFSLWTFGKRSDMSFFRSHQRSRNIFGMK